MIPVITNIIRKKTRCKCCKDCKMSKYENQLFVFQIALDIVVIFIFFVFITSLIDHQEEYLEDACPIKGLSPTEMSLLRETVKSRALQNDTGLEDFEQISLGCNTFNVTNMVPVEVDKYGVITELPGIK